MKRKSNSRQQRAMYDPTAAYMKPVNSGVKMLPHSLLSDGPKELLVGCVPTGLPLPGMLYGWVSALSCQSVAVPWPAA